MRIALIALVGVTAACKQLPDIPVGLCGNHILETGEDCDSGDDPNCAPPGTPDACHLKCAGGGCAAGEICADTGFCRPTENVCGNQVVEAGEDCDAAGDANCGAPGTDRACRFLCGAAACPAGYFCGRDQICRIPTGSYTLGPAVGAPNSVFGLLDVNADGFPDLVERGLSELIIRTNDQHGALETFGSGPVHLLPNLGSLPGIDTPQAPLTNQPLFAAETQYGIELLALVPGKHLQPLVAVTSLLPPAIALKQFQGTVRRDPAGGAEALYFDPTSHTLLSYSAPADYSNGAAMTLQATLDPSKPPCSHRPNKIVTTVATPTGKLSSLGLKMDDTVFCVATPNAAGGYDLAALDTSSLGTNLFLEQPPLFADIDGDGQLDVLLHDDFTNFGRMIAFRRLGAGYRPPVALDMNQVVSPYNIAAFDMNGDGRDDILYAGSVYLNRTGEGVPDGGFNADAGLEWQPPPPEELLFSNDSNWAADVNHDHDGDMILSSTTGAGLLVCLGDGSGARFTCQIEVTLISGIKNVVLADVNGNQTTDILAAAVPNPSAALANDGMDLLLGKPFMTPDPIGTALPVYRGTLDGVGRLPSQAHIADDLLAAITTTSNKQGVAVGLADSQSGQPAFAYPFADARDMRFTDEDRDGIADLALLQSGGVTILHGGANAGFAGGLKVYSGQDTMGNWIFPDPTATGATPLRFASLPNDPLPAVVGMDLFSGLVIAHLKSGAFQSKAFPIGNPLEALTEVRDLDGDGNNEIFVFYNDGNTSNTMAGAFKPGADYPDFPTPTTFQQCSADFYFLADSPPFDGRLDLWLAQPDPKTKVEKWTIHRGNPDGTFNTQTVLTDAGLFNANGKKQGFDPNWGYIDARDVNGDGIPDLLVDTPNGAAVLTADVRIR